MGLLSNLTFGLFDPKTASAQDVGLVGYGTGYTTGPQAAPTPFQPAAQGGNPYLTPPTNPNSGAGPYVPQSAVPTSNNNGVVGFSNNARIGVQNTQPNPNPAPAPTPSSTSMSDSAIIDAYRKMGWNDPNAILADYRATGGSKISGGNNDQPPSPPAFKTDTTKTGGLLSEINPTSTTIDGGMEDYFGKLKAAAEAGDQAAVDQLNQVYGQQGDTLNKQLGQTDVDKATAEKELALQLSNAETDTATQRTKAQESVMTESEKASEAARSAQRKNRSIMRALGILGSTYAAEALQNPMNELAKQKATFAKWGMDQVATLDQNFTKFKGELTLQKDKILSQYATIKAKIQDDIRYNDQQKATSLQALKAGAQQNLAQIQGQMVNYQQQLDQQKLGFTQQIAQILLNKNPNADIGAIMAQAQKTTGQMFPASQQVATVGATPGRNTLSGFSMDNYIGWNPATAQEDYKKKKGLA